MDSNYTSRKCLKDTDFKDVIKEDTIQHFNKMKKTRYDIYKTGCPAICKERNKTYFSKDPLLKEEKI